jgi:hypothetical protein
VTLRRITDGSREYFGHTLWLSRLLSLNSLVYKCDSILAVEIHYSPDAKHLLLDVFQSNSISASRAPVFFQYLIKALGHFMT